MIVVIVTITIIILAVIIVLARHLLAVNANPQAKEANLFYTLLQAANAGRVASPRADWLEWLKSS